MGSHFHLAQVNLKRMRGPREDPATSGSSSRLDEINELAEGTPGLIWRPRDHSGNATYIRPYRDHQILFKLSVWESVEALAAFTYRSDHKEIVAGRKPGFDDIGQPSSELWRVQSDRTPGVKEATDPLEHLRTDGPTACAFGLRTIFPVPVKDRMRAAPSAAEASSGL